MRRFVGKADHSERERRERTDIALRKMGMVGWGLSRMNHLRREMERMGVSELGSVGVFEGKLVERVERALRGAAVHFAVLDGALVDAEAVPSSLVELLERRKAEIGAMVSGREVEIPGRVSTEGAADGFWSAKIRSAYMGKLVSAAAKVRGERFKEFREERYKDFSEGWSGVWFQKAKEKTARVLNQMPVGGGVGLEGGLEAFQRQYGAMFEVSYEKNPVVTGPLSTKYAGEWLRQLKYLLRRGDCGKVELNDEAEILEAMEADGVNCPEVLEATSKVLRDFLAHMDQWMHHFLVLVLNNHHVTIKKMLPKRHPYT